MKIPRYILLLFIVLVYGCGAGKKVTEQPNRNSKEYVFPYEINQPDNTRVLPKSLKEISGLTNDGEGGFFAVQDEEGFVFHIQEEEITKTEFRDKGDYEGIEKVGDVIYVVKSSGNIYRITDLGTDFQKVEKLKFFLNKQHNVEGLCFDKKTNSLLLVCKGAYDNHDYRSIYRFDLESQNLLEKPFVDISLENLKKTIIRLSEKDAGFRKLYEEKGDKLTFAPSAIDIHPFTGNFYITSSKGKMLLVMDRNGEIIQLIKLEKKIHRQPEGLCFGKDGTLYISNEGKDGEAKLHTFKLKSL